MSLKSASQLPLYSDSDLYFVLPHYFIGEFSYAKSLENGIFHNSDPEFNHQYRVTLRRIRSLCILLEDILSPFELNLLKPHLKLLMKRTNLLRDLDVFIIDKPRYAAMLPEYGESLERIFSVIQSRQIDEQKRVADWLSSDMYLNTSVLISNSLMRALQYDHRRKPVSPLQYANKKILKQFNKVIKSTKPITEDSEDSTIHSLRIKCKSLRYLLESFSTLYDSVGHKQNVKHLKFLQDQLGDFNDTATQITFFNQIRKDDSVKKVDRKALKTLIREIKAQHEDSRRKILPHIKQFEQFLKETSALELYRG